MKAKKYSLQKASSIINPQAANRKWLRRKRLRSYIQNNMPCQIIEIQGSKEDTIEKTKKLSLKHNIIVAVGGDGTVADVIQGIIEARREKNITLGILPFGSGNAFRKSLGIPKNMKKAIKLLSEGKSHKIDLICTEGRAGGFASVGATAKVTQVKYQHSIQGLLGHLLASRVLFTLSRKDLEIELIDGMDDSGQHFDKKIFNIRIFDCVVGKTNHFGYSWKVAPRAKIDDGFLDITFFETSGLKYLLCFPLIYFGLYQKTQKHFKARKMTIRGQNLPIQQNGEFLGLKDKIEFKVLPKTLKIISPNKGN